MHPHDRNCRWCGFGPLTITTDGWVSFNPHACPGKPPQTAEDGAAVAFGIIGMAEAIRANQPRPHVGTCTGSRWVYPK